MTFNVPGQNAALSGGLGDSITHIGVHTLTDPGTGTNANSGEATGGSPAYARQAVTWASPASGQRSNSGALTFDVPAGTYGYLTYWNASSGNTNNFRGYAPLGGSVKGFGTSDATGVTNNTITSSAHGLADNDRVIVYNVLGETIPAGLTEGTVYYVVNSTTDTFKVSTTSGGSAVDITGQGEVFFQKIVPETFNGQGQITVAVGAVVLDASGI